MKKLYKTRRGNILDGVCNGIAQYIELDVTLVRVLFAVFTVGGGFSIFAYVLCMFIMPREPEGYDMEIVD